MYNKSKLVNRIETLINVLQNELTRIASESCDTPDKAIEQRVKLEQIHVEITHLEEMLK